MSLEPDVKPLPLLTAAEMQAWDRRAIEAMATPGAILMESAGRAAAALVDRLHPAGRIVAVVGRGNNGGDALVLLRTLRAWGRDVFAVLADGASIAPELSRGWEIPSGPSGGAEMALAGAAVVVDGLLGTGASGAPREPEARLIREMNAAGKPVVALDGPSGVDMTTGVAAGEAVSAQLTITFGAPKRGLLLFPGREFSGRIAVVEIGLPPVHPDEAAAAVITDEWVRAELPRRPLNAHKGGSGTIAVIAGHPGMGGAASLVAMGALRAGTGKVRVIAPEANRVALQVSVPEALFVDRDGPSVEEVLRTADAIVAGPGMGMDGGARRLLEMALRASRAPMVADADAITMIAESPDLLDGVERDRIALTPHPGEMSRLLGLETKAVVADPFGAVEDAMGRLGVAVLLKGSPTLIASPATATLVNVAGHSGIATSGMGDTLAGVIGALLGMGVAPREAAALGVFVAGRAAEAVGRGRTVLPRDVAELLPSILDSLGHPGSAPEPGVLLDLPAAR